MGITIRKAQEDDAQGMIDVLNPIIEAGIYSAMDTACTLEGQRDFIRGFPDRGTFHVAIDSDTGRLLGCQDVMPMSSSRAFAHVGEISTFVALGGHGQGVGARLSAATFEACARLGFEKIMATIRADNPRAVAFYLGQGFRIIGTAQRHAKIGGVFIDEIMAEKHLSEPQ